MTDGLLTIERERGRARRKFAFGVLEQASNIFGAMTASVTVVGLILPAIATFSGTSQITRGQFFEIAMLVIAFAFTVASCALILRGLARRLEDFDHG
jgi:hypothetical protein